MNAFPVISVGIGYQTKQLIFLFVVLYLRTGIIKIIAIYIEYSPDTFGVFLCTVVCIRLENTVHKLVFGRSGRTGLIVVINKVIAATLSGITTIGRPPIIEYIISQVNQFRIGSTGVAAATKTGSPAAMMCQ